MTKFEDIHVFKFVTLLYSIRRESGGEREREKVPNIDKMATYNVNWHIGEMDSDVSTGKFIN